jgi:hypothetical protein
MCDVSAAKIKAAFDGKMSSVFDLLRDQLAEDDLFGEILAADYDAVAMGAGRKKEKGRSDETNRFDAVKKSQLKTE